MERFYMFEHSTWFRPYAAAYYAVREGMLSSTTDYFESLFMIRREFIEAHIEFLLSLGKPEGIT